METRTRLGDFVLVASLLRADNAHADAAASERAYQRGLLGRKRVRARVRRSRVFGAP